MNIQRVNKNVLWFVFAIVILTFKCVAGQQLNCIVAADTRLTVVVTPAVVKLGGTTVVQCQVAPPSKNFCDFRITLGSRSKQQSFDKTNCHRGTISEPRYTGLCDVTAGRYGLRIESVQMSDAGTWSCDYMNAFPNSKTEITVVAPPSGPVLTSQPNTAINNIVAVQENSPLTITCDGSQPGATGLTYKWSGVNPSGQSNNKLSFRRISKTDSGVYTCNVLNTYGSVTGNITIDVLYPPSSVILQGPTSPVQESTSVDLTCTATGGNPVPNLAITKTAGGSTVKQGVSPLTYSTSATKTDNQAEYQCTATGAGIPTPMISNKVKLTVNYPADSVSLIPVKSVVTEGNSIRLNCTATGGNPTRYNYIWKFSTVSGVWKSIGSTNGILALDNLSKADSGRYRCNATNVGGSTLSNISIVDVQYAPSLIGQIETVAAKVGENAEFAINYNANPSATTLNCSHNSTNAEYVINNTSLTQWDVIIQSVQASDYGSFSCKLNNTIGSIKITLKLTRAAIPSAINTALKQATIFREGNLVLVKLSSFPSKYSVYVEYCTKDTNQCTSTKAIETTGGAIAITIKIEPDQAYSYKLIVSEGSDVIASQQIEIPVTPTITNIGLIGGVVVGVLLVTIIVIVFVFLFVKWRRDGQWIWTKNRAQSSASVPSPNTDTDGHIFGPAGDVYAQVNKKPKSRPTANDNHVTTNDGSVDNAEPLYAQVDKNKKRDGKKAKNPQKNILFENDVNPYQIVGDEENPYHPDVDDDNDEEIQKFAICVVDNPAYIVDEKKEPIYLHVVNNIGHQAPPSVFIGDFDDFSTYSELGRVVEPQVQAELVARLEAEEAERRKQREELEKQKKSY
ncbi:uncharacterized protein LOC141902196 [Tubulanus polymorphus]|uniref:uncharacterized protein LOC141902196 n=1 Tax=Tubulanus polymorphus TaxID=672921 RepID=UPI003DA21015